MALIAHWPLNGNTNDVSGNNYTLTNNGATVITNGKIGNAYSFAGSPQWMNRTFPSNILMLSFSYWVYFRNWINGGNYVTSSLNYSPNPYGFSMQFNYTSTSVRFYAGSSASGRFANISHPSGAIQLNKWHHITNGYDPIQKKFFLYIDGQFIGYSPTISFELDGFSNVIGVGRWANDFNNYYSDMIVNDVRVFDYVLTDIEVQEIARAKILHYSFDDFQEPTTNLVVNPLNPTVSPWANINMISTQDSNGFYKASETTTSGSHIAGQPFTTQANTIYTQSVVVKPHGRRYVGLSFTNYGNWTGGNGGHTYFDLEAGIVFSTIGSGPIDKGIKNLGDGSFRLYITALSTNAVSSRINLFTYPDSALTEPFVGDVTKGIFFKEYQLEKKSHPTEFVVGTRSSTIRDNSGFFNDSEIVTLNGYGYKVDHTDQYGTWIKIFRHDLRSSITLFSNSTEAQYTNPDNPMANKFSLLNQIGEFIRTDSKYKFKLSYPLQEGISNSGYTNIWFQTSNPITSDIEVRAGYQPISVQATSQSFSGLARSSATTSTYLDATPGGNWFYAIGAFSVWNGGIPGPYEVAVNQGIQLVELFICIEDTKFINRYPRWTSDSKIGGGSYFFNGSTSAIIRPMLDALGYQSFTINLWAYFDDDNARDVILGTFDNGAALSFNIEKHTSNRLRFYWQGVNDIFTANNTLPIQQWCMVTVVRDKDNGRLKMFVNGVSVYNELVTINDILTFNSKNLYFGRDIRTTSEATKGKLDDIRFYTIALSDKDILDLYSTKAEIEQSGVLYARDFLSNAEATSNIIINGNPDNTQHYSVSPDTASGDIITFSLIENDGFINNKSIEFNFQNRVSWGYARHNIFSYLGSGWFDTTAQYTLSMYIKAISGTNTVSVSIRNGPSTNIVSPSMNMVLADSTNWKRYAMTFTPSTTGLDPLLFFTGNTGNRYRISGIQLEKKGYATPYVSTFRPAIELPTGITFGADEIHETGIANFEDFSTVGIADGLDLYMYDSTFKDYSGNSYNGTASNITLSGNNYIFNGSTSSITIPNGINYSSGFTLSAFINPTSAGGGTFGRIFDKTNGATNSTNGLFFYMNNGTLLAFQIHTGASLVTASGTVPFGVFSHVLVTVNSAGNAIIYVNGQSSATGTTSAPSTITTTNLLTIGNRSGATDRGFNGRISNLKIFNRALTAEEIQIEYNTMFNNQVQIHESGVVYARDLEQY